VRVHRGGKSNGSGALRAQRIVRFLFAAFVMRRSSQSVNRSAERACGASVSAEMARGSFAARHSPPLAAQFGI